MKKRDRLINLPYSEYRSYKGDKLKKLAKDITTIARQEQQEAKETIKREKLPIPTAYKNWNNKPRTEENIGKIKDFSWLDYDFRITSDMNDNQLKHIINKSQKFLKTETHTIEKWKEHLNQFADRLNERLGEDIIDTGKMSKANYKRLWDIYNMIDGQFNLDLAPQGYDSTQIQAMLYEIYTDDNAKYTTDTLILSKFRDLLKEKDEDEKKKDNEDLPNVLNQNFSTKIDDENGLLETKYKPRK